VSFDEILARKITKTDFDNFDYLMCMDRSHYRKLMQLAKVQHQEKVKLFLEFCEVPNMWNNEVVDPYYKGDNAFDDVFDIVDEAVEGLFKMLLLIK